MTWGLWDSAWALSRNPIDSLALRGATPRAREVARQGLGERRREPIPVGGTRQERRIVGVIQVHHLDENLRRDGVSLEDRRKPDLTAADHPVADRLERLDRQVVLLEVLDDDARELPGHRLRTEPVPLREADARHLAHLLELKVRGVARPHRS